jgi:hypothetical protein
MVVSYAAKKVLKMTEKDIIRYSGAIYQHIRASIVCPLYSGADVCIVRWGTIYIRVNWHPLTKALGLGVSTDATGEPDRSESSFEDRTMKKTRRSRSIAVFDNSHTTKCLLLDIYPYKIPTHPHRFKPEPLGQGFENWDSSFARGRSFQIRLPQPNHNLLEYYEIARSNKETKWIWQLPYTETQFKEKQRRRRGVGTDEILIDERHTVYAEERSKDDQDCHLTRNAGTNTTLFLIQRNNTQNIKCLQG